MRHALPVRGYGTQRDLVMLIGRKYPLRLADLYRTVLQDRPELESYALVTAIGQSSLPREMKVKLLTPATRHKSLSHRQWAFAQLSALDPPLFAERLIEALEEVPAEPQPSDDLRPKETMYASLATLTSDPQVWKALEKTTRRVGVSLRLEFLETARYAYHIGDERRRKEQLEFLKAFLNDTTVRELKRDVKWNPYFAAERDYPRIEVRNFAALSLGQMLKIGSDPKPDWGEEDWAKLRREVREALRRKP